jgi:ATP-binding cassette subfamily B protein
MDTTEFRPKGRSLRPLRALGPFLWRYRGTMLLALLALLIASGAMLALPVAVRYLIDHGMAAGDARTINRYSWPSWVPRWCLACFGPALLPVTWLGERVIADVGARGNGAWCTWT